MTIERPRPLIDWKEQKVVVLQSDDWGSCSYFPTPRIYETARERLPEDLRRNAADTLECAEDLETLFRLLREFRGGDGRGAVLQANYVLANPDFEAAAQNGSFRGIALPDLPSQWQRPGLFDKVKEGIGFGVWHPEFHGYLHYNHRQWLRDIARKDPAALQSLEWSSIAAWAALHRSDYRQPRAYYDRISELGSIVPLREQEEAIGAGLERFATLFSRQATSFIAPAYCWQSRTERVLSRRGIRVVQARDRRHQPETIGSRVRRRLFGSNAAVTIRMGARDARTRLRFLVRNVDFEPYLPGRGAGQAWEGIVRAWGNGEPAVVSTHRVNYSGHDRSRVATCREELGALLATIAREYPATVFLTDHELDQLYGTGVSVRYAGAGEIICRNLTPTYQRIRVELRRGTRATGVFVLPRGKQYRSYSQESGVLEIETCPGHLRVDVAEA